ncbi:hypothetical protein ANCDUO_21853, partial [Ancylostoma duodenale]
MAHIAIPQLVNANAILSKAVAIVHQGVMELGVNLSALWASMVGTAVSRVRAKTVPLVSQETDSVFVLLDLREIIVNHLAKTPPTDLTVTSNATVVIIPVIQEMVPACAPLASVGLSVNK